MRRITYFTVILTVIGLSVGLSQRAQAQQVGGVVFEFPEIRNYVAVGVGVVPDYMGSDDYTVGAAPAGLMKIGSSDRYVVCS